MPRLRLLDPDDVPALTRLLVANRDFLAPWEPRRAAGWFTEDGQRTVARQALERYASGVGVPFVVLDDDGSVVGRLNLVAIEHGVFRSARLGYWVAQAANGRGLATAAVGEALAHAFGPLALHRVEAGTLAHNHASQRVLARNGFVRIGRAPQYLLIDGRWQDHLLFQALSPAG
ncbi:ribosomal-protein-alanine N-acetyltransferase [Friedmanniella endophytica]|uniref:Ribosomal-protein-alanine N-acetyltransferase n=1 Tax=Microlunatus kandeliicorticis TaxID=1759536 RepID=A0A7W3ITI5_9ACTN|nr:GNAT family protein [Microlunatus kandeliicorticis]MBA8794981.1 ribosomal-protein-alanine N-acetyltransferase [Microlunatus kandeliicorticis]